MDYPDIPALYSAKDKHNPDLIRIPCFTRQFFRLFKYALYPFANVFNSLGNGSGIEIIHTLGGMRLFKLLRIDQDFVVLGKMLFQFCRNGIQFAAIKY